MTIDPIAVHLFRGSHVESVHTGSLVVTDAMGNTITMVGDGARPVFPRSAIKPFQAMPLVESGAADHFQVSRAELALACASHNGEPMHVERVLAWLERIGRREDDLGCGPHPPIDPASDAQRIRDGRPVTRAFNNCSGKHTGMLATSMQLGAPIERYLEPDHPVQRAVAEALCEMTGLARLPAPGIDGCGVPSWPIPLAALARGAARLVDTRGLGAARAASAARIGEAMSAHPELVAGHRRLCTALMAEAPWILAKTGAEGVYICGNRRTGHGLALKIDDGATRAAEVLLLATMVRLGWLDEPLSAALGHHAARPLHNYAGTEVGRIDVEPAFLAALG